MTEQISTFKKVTLAGLALALSTIVVSPVHAALSCNSCHGMPPQDSPLRSPSSGAFTGNHQTHQPVNATATDCATCHVTSGFTSSHRDGKIGLQPNLNSSPATGQYIVGVGAVSFKNQTSVPVLGSCSNVNCHFERTSPDWGTPYLGARSDAVCSTCHDSVPTTNAHSKHTALYVAKNGGVAADTCNNCHLTNYSDATHASQVGRPINVTLASGKYSTAMKTSYLPSQQTARVEGDCSNLYCHSNGSGTFAKPNWGTPASGACGTCHAAPPTSATHTAFGTAANTCSTCHVFTGVNGATHLNGAVNKAGVITVAPHVNNSVLGTYSAAYITSRSSCADCHNTTAGNQAIRQQWAASGHGNTDALPWVNYDFKTRTGCVQCHTTTGFIAFSTAKVPAPWGTAGDVGTKEVLTCKGCHSDVAAGTVRTVTPSKPFDIDNTYQNVDVATSNICMDCHAGRNNGANIQAKVGVSDFTNLAFVSPHYLSAAGSLQGKTGYHFPGRSYTAFADNSHGKVGVANANTTGTGGPCVACHMSATDKHEFNPFTTDTNGAITAITTSVCTNCHSTSLPAATLEAKRIDFTGGIAILRAALLARTPSIVVTDAYPYVANRNWGSGQTGANLMGATYNLKLFLSEPGAYTHNPEYAKQILSDSIEAAVTGGTVTGDINGALATLVIAGTITQTQADNLIAYRNPESSCITCHGNPPTDETHIGIAAGTCSSCHIYTGVNGTTHNNGTVDLNLDAASCNTCHGYPPAPRVTETQLTFGVQGQWSSARFEDYSGGGGAHAVVGHNLKTIKPSDGWTPCLTCHSGGASQHSRTLPVRNHVENVTVTVQAKWQFSNATLPVYTSAKLSSGGGNKSGNCFNVSCHFKPTTKWSIER